LSKVQLITLNEKAIEEDAKWDGFHGIAVSNSSKLTVERALSRYRDLYHVEEAFRVVKCTLKTRPIFSLGTPPYPHTYIALLYEFISGKIFRTASQKKGNLIDSRSH
jgi:hypothetical protein